MKTQSTTQAAELVGMIEQGACGMVPHIRCDFPMPKLTNNGYACYIGMPKLTVPNLYAALPDDVERRPMRQDHVLVSFSDGKHFLSYACMYREGDAISLS